MGDVADAKLTQDQALERIVAPGSVYETGRERLATHGGEEFTVFKHAPRNLGELYALSARHDDRTFIVYEDETYTFAQARQRAANLAHRLVTDLGIGKGDRVALVMRNYPEWALVYMAVTSVGAVLVPLNAWWKGAELRYGIEDSGAKLVVVDQERLERLAPELPALGVPALVARPAGELPEGAAALAELFEGARAAPAVEVAPDDDATILYTSGSTGHAKGVVSSHRAVVSAVFTWEVSMMSRILVELPPQIVQRVEQWAQQGAAALTSSPFRMPQRSMLVTVPLFHVTGCNVQFLPAFRNGRKIVMMYKWNPERALELIEREKITDFNGVPTMSWELVNSPDFGKRDTSSLQSLSAGGAARPPDQVKKLKERAGGAQASTGYGMTETNSLGAAIGGDDYQDRPDSVGRALRPLVELKVIDEQGEALGTDAEGEICIKSVTNMRCYWGKPEETLETLRHGWVHTGDLGRIDAEGYLFITGRAKDIVIRGGENISCPEVEHALYEHPAVFEAAVYGVPDERLGEALAATVMVRPGMGVTAEELQQHVAGLLAAFKVPSHVWLQQEQLPRIASGKIDKRALKAAGAERVA
ncbi:MAG: class I adenylate-forming enzyme family protein [Myxococcales bacterium]|nr:class I adenylate-forming enzyme family protein [Myxococcales bacterium]